MKRSYRIQDGKILIYQEIELTDHAQYLKFDWHLYNLSKDIDEEFIEDYTKNYEYNRKDAFKQIEPQNIEKILQEYIYQLILDQDLFYLLDSKYHLSLLDKFVGNKIEDLLSKYNDSYKLYLVQIRRELFRELFRSCLLFCCFVWKSPFV